MLFVVRQWRLTPECEQVSWFAPSVSILQNFYLVEIASSELCLFVWSMAHEELAHGCHQRCTEQLDDALEEIDNLNNNSEYINIDQQTMHQYQTASEEASYDFVFKFLLVGDSDVGKEEILQKFKTVPGDLESAEYRSLDVNYKSTSLLLDGKTVKLRIW